MLIGQTTFSMIKMTDPSPSPRKLGALSMTTMEDWAKQCRADALMDLAYCNGAKAALNAEARCAPDDVTPIEKFEKSIERRRSDALRVLNCLRTGAGQYKESSE
jgi:hypothetical protein